MSDISFRVQRVNLPNFIYLAMVSVWHQIEADQYTIIKTTDTGCENQAYLGL